MLEHQASIAVGGDCPALPCTDVASAQVLSAVLGASVSEGCQAVRLFLGEAVCFKVSSARLGKSD